MPFLKNSKSQIDECLAKTLECHDAIRICAEEKTKLNDEKKECDAQIEILSLRINEYTSEHEKLKETIVRLENTLTLCKNEHAICQEKLSDISNKYAETNKLLQNCKVELKDSHKKYEDTNKLLQSCSDKKKSHDDRCAKRKTNDNKQDDNIKKDAYINKLYSLRPEI